MAKFRRARRFFGRAARRAAHYARHGSSKPEGMILPAAAYGVGRQTIAGLISPLSSKIPGGYGDELILGTGGYLLAKKGRGMVKQFGLAVLTIEIASAAQQATAGLGNSGHSYGPGFG